MYFMILFVHFYIKKYNSVPFYFISCIVEDAPWHLSPARSLTGHIIRSILIQNCIIYHTADVLLCTRL